MLKSFLKFFYWFYFKKSNFSQGKEEEILNDVFFSQKKGFYVDVGCYHPRRFSNTTTLYNRGWNGINIDANKKNLKLFNIFRKRDKNINALISEKSENLKYYYFDESALNGVLSETRLNYLIDLGYKVVKEENLVTKRLDELLNFYEVPNKKIDLLDIDVEGLDLQVLKSLDLNIYNVELILIEVGDNENEIVEYLTKFNYFIYAREDRNIFFRKNKL
jgi:FkbM family methyltransferase